ncbi:MAG: Methionyl-tRNA formyltransferase [Bacteroidota bacterium]
MTHARPRIVFMGTPAFAVASLEALVGAGWNVVGVITAPDKPAGRGLKLTPSAVNVCVGRHGIPVLQPTNLKSPEFQKELADLAPDLQVVVAFRMLPESVWKLPVLGTFNLHASLLPQYRGAAPINWSIINGDRETGVTTFFLQQEIDTGSVIFQERVTIGPDETAGELHDRLMQSGAELVLKTVAAIAANDVHPIPQNELLKDHSTLRPAPKLNRDNTRIDWNRSATEIHDLVRGLSPYPSAYTLLTLGTDKLPLQFKIYRTRPVAGNTGNGIPGTVTTDDKGWLKVATGSGQLEILELQPSGKQRMPVRDFLNGFRFTESNRFE